jgi:hypothetical protein
MKKIKKGFMCGVAFLDELENTDVKVFPSISSLKESHSHACNGCGIVEVEIKIKRWRKKQNFN